MAQLRLELLVVVLGDHPAQDDARVLGDVDQDGVERLAPDVVEGDVVMWFTCSSHDALRALDDRVWEEGEFGDHPRMALNSMLTHDELVAAQAIAGDDQSMYRLAAVNAKRLTAAAA